MSVSDQETKNSRQAQVHGPGNGRWYLAALVLHALVLAALIWLTPLRGLMTEEQPEASPVRRMSSEEIREVRRTVEQASAAKLTRDLDRLDEIRREMAEMEKERLEQLESATPESESDPQQALASMRKAESAMYRSAEAMEESKEAEDAERSAQLDEIDKHLEESFDRLPAFEPQYRSVMGELDQVRSLQDRARQAWTRTTIGEESDELEDARRDAERRASDYQKKLAEADKKDRQVVERREKLEAEHQKLADLKRDLASETDERKIKRLEDKIRQQEQRIADRTRQVDQYAAKAVEYREQLAEREEQAVAAKSELKAVKEELDDTRESALEWERKAITAQQQAIAQMERALEGGQSPPEATPAKPTPEQAYEMALEREREITENYKTWRAAELALLREMPLGEALRQTDVVRPERPALDTVKPDGSVDSASALEARKQQLETVLRETGSMVSLAENLLGMSRRQSARRSEGLAISLENERQRAESQARLASVDLSGRIADMTILGSGQPGEGTGRTGDGGPAGSAGQGQGDGQGGESGKPGNGSGGGAGMGEGRFASGAGDRDSAPEEVGVGRLDGFARKISPNGDPARWMSPNSWYVIGPFANPRRSNIDRQFPPESVIDLDASYIGKENRIIRWEYHTAEHAKVIPRSEEPYGIWYATTEIWSDADRDVWLAMGSDDQGRVWVNGQLVWISASKHKDWTLGEALRRVHLEAGRNRLLYRIENGHGGMAFSLCICLDEQE